MTAVLCCTFTKINGTSLPESKNTCISELYDTDMDLLHRPVVYIYLVGILHVELAGVRHKEACYKKNTGKETFR